jgi:hypothetical protein
MNNLNSMAEYLETSTEILGLENELLEFGNETKTSNRNFVNSNYVGKRQRQRDVSELNFASRFLRLTFFLQRFARL